MPEEGYKLYLRPTMAQAMENIQKTWGSKWDRVEREHVTGGVPQVWIELPGVYTKREDAEKAQKVF